MNFVKKHWLAILALALLLYAVYQIYLGEQATANFFQWLKDKISGFFTSYPKVSTDANGNTVTDYGSGNVVTTDASGQFISSTNVNSNGTLNLTTPPPNDGFSPSLNADPNADGYTFSSQ